MKKTILAIATAGIVGLFSVSGLHGQGIVDPRSGQLFLTATDLVLQAGPINLEIRRSLDPGSHKASLLGTRWMLNWESRLSRTASSVLIEEGAGTLKFDSDGSASAYKNLSGDRVVFEKNGRAIRTKSDGIREFFDAQGRLTERDYRNENRAVLSYGPDGRLAKIEGPFGSYFRFTTDKEGRVVLVEISTMGTVRYGYVKGELAEVQVGSRPPVRYSYDAERRLVSMEDPRSGIVQFSYDAKGRVTSRRWFDGSNERYAYDDSSNRLLYTSASGGVTTIQWSQDKRHEEVIDPLGRKTISEYDDAGRLLSVVGPTGAASRLTYEPLGRTVALTNSFGHVTRFEYLGESTLIKAIIQPDGKQRTFEYDAQGNLMTVKAGSETIAAYSYYPDGNVASMMGRGRPAQTFAYDPNGRLKSVTDALGGKTQFEYDPRGNLIREIDLLGGITVRSYDSEDRLIGLTDPAGGTTRYNYSKGGLLISIVDPTGGVTQYTYNDRDWLVSKTDPVGRVTRYEYNADGRMKSVTDPPGQSSRFEYEYAPTGNLLRVINALGAVTTKTYDPLGRLTTLSFPSGATAQYEYSADGLLTKFTAPSGRITTYRYDSQGRMIESIRGADRVTRYEYNTDGVVEKVIPPSGPVVSYEYDETSRLTAVAEDGQPIVRYEYDKLGRRTKESYAKGLEISYRYDAQGNLIAWEDNLEANARIEYDGQGRPTAISDSFGKMTRYGHDLSGRLISIINPLGEIKRLTYSPAGELTGVIEPSHDRAEYNYNSAGYLEKIHHPSGGEVTIDYSPLGDPAIVKDPLGKESRKTYDPSGYLLSMTDAKGQTITFAYDAAGRLSQKRLPDGKIVSYRYDSTGKLSKVDDGAFPVQYGYDANNRLIEVDYPAIKRTLRYEYDDRDLLSKFVDSEGGIVRYEYDAAKRPTRIILPGGQAIIITYDEKDRPTSLAYPNGIKGSWSYDAEGRPVSITFANGKGATIAGWHYKYDAAGNRVATVDAQGLETRFRYDSAGQLLEETDGTGRLVRYSYLPGGNRERREGEGRTVKYRYDRADRLLEAGEETFIYDANGNVTERRGPNGATRYTYDAQDQLIKIALPDGREVSFGYSPTGERIWRRDSTGLTYFVTDGLNLLAELDENLRPKTKYSYGPGIDRPLVMVRERQAYFYHADVLGSVSSLTDGQGQVVESYDYDAFGAVKKKSGTLKNPFTFAGREYDETLKIYFNRARYYDPSFGRFLARDPVPGNLFDPLSFNAYVYAQNNPVRYVDPFGKAKIKIPPPIKVTHVDTPVPGLGGLYDPKNEIRIFPDARKGPLERAQGVIRHEQTHHVQWQVEMAERARAGGINWALRPPEEQVDQYKAWIKKPGVRNSMEQTAYLEEAHVLIEKFAEREFPPSFNDPQVQNELKNLASEYESYGGDGKKLMQAAQEYHELLKDPSKPTPVHNELQQRLDAVKPSGAQGPPPEGPEPWWDTKKPSGPSDPDPGLARRVGGSEASRLITPQQAVEMIAFIAVNALACLRENHGTDYCAAETELGTAAGLALVLALKGLAAGATAITPEAIAAVVAPFAAALAAPLAAGVTAGMAIAAIDRLMNADKVAAEAARQAQLQANFEKQYITDYAALEAQIKAHEKRAGDVKQAYEKAKTAWTSAKQSADAADSNLAALKGALSATAGGENCGNADAVRQQVESLASDLEKQEADLETGLKAAEGYVTSCTKKEDVTWAENLYETAKGLVAGMMVKANRAENSNEVLKQAKAAADKALAAVAQGETLAQTIASNANTATEQAGNATEPAAIAAAGAQALPGENAALTAKVEAFPKMFPQMPMIDGAVQGWLGRLGNAHVPAEVEDATNRASAAQDDATRAKSDRDEAQRLVAKAKDQTSQCAQVQSADDAASRAQAAATTAELAMHGFSDLPEMADVCIASLTPLQTGKPSAPGPDDIDNYDPTDPTKEPNKGNKGAPVDPNIAKDFEDKQPGAKAPVTTGTVSTAPPVPIPGGEEVPVGGVTAGTTTAGTTPGAPPLGQIGVGYPPKGPSVPSYTQPSGQQTGKGPGTTSPGTTPGVTAQKLPAQTPSAAVAQCRQPLCNTAGQAAQEPAVCEKGPLPNEPGWIPACYENMLARCIKGEAEAAAGRTGGWCVRKGADASCEARARRVCGGGPSGVGSRPAALPGK